MKLEMAAQLTPEMQRKKNKRNTQNMDICPFAVQLNEPKIVK